MGFIVAVMLFSWIGISAQVVDKIVIDKQTLCLSVYKNGEVIDSFGVACGKNLGNKCVSGDFKTPEGDFEICGIQNSSYWSHDFKDGKGVIDGAYGPYFFRLKGKTLSPQTGIGIHGTHAPESIGSRCTEGCIRLKNEDLKKLHKYVYVGLKVRILADEMFA